MVLLTLVIGCRNLGGNGPGKTPVKPDAEVTKGYLGVARVPF